MLKIKAESAKAQCYFLQMLGKNKNNEKDKVTETESHLKRKQLSNSDSGIYFWRNYMECRK